VSCRFPVGPRRGAFVLEQHFRPLSPFDCVFPFFRSSPCGLRRDCAAHSLSGELFFFSKVMYFSRITVFRRPSDRSAATLEGANALSKTFYEVFPGDPFSCTCVKLFLSGGKTGQAISRFRIDRQGGDLVHALNRFIEFIFLIFSFGFNFPPPSFKAFST